MSLAVAVKLTLENGSRTRHW